jgi:hypothetical protein
MHTNYPTPSRARAPCVPLPRVISGQQRSLMSPVTVYPQASIGTGQDLDRRPTFQAGHAQGFRAAVVPASAERLLPITRRAAVGPMPVSARAVPLCRMCAQSARPHRPEAPFAQVLMPGEVSIASPSQGGSYAGALAAIPLQRHHLDGPLSRIRTAGWSPGAISSLSNVGGLLFRSGQLPTRRRPGRTVISVARFVARNAGDWG